jgi:transcriptional activator protein UGA3
LAQVNSLLGHPDPQSTLEACTAVLLLCLTELFDGSSRVWKWHLKAAGAILQSPGMEPMASTAEWSFCSSLFHYLDAMSTISRCKPPLLHEGESLTDLTRVRSSSTSKVPRADSAAIYGISPTLFDLLGMVNLLAKHRSRRTDELAEIGFRAAAAHLEAQIDEWRVEHDLVELGRFGDRAAEQTTTAFEWAVRLRLHQIVDGYDPQHETVQRAVSAILDAALQVPYGSRVEGCLLFPLVIAGASSTAIEGRMMVKERLMVMENTLGFAHIQHARQLLETVWDGEQAAEPNWAFVRYNRFPGVVFI